MWPARLRPTSRRSAAKQNLQTTVSIELHVTLSLVLRLRYRLTVEAELEDRDAAAKRNGGVVEKGLPVARNVAKLEHTDDSLLRPDDEAAHRSDEAGIPLRTARPLQRST